ncbi:hypothetical protein Tco_1425128 [Tanacetum coccineum]
MLPKSHQALYDDPDAYVGLYIHSFTQSNLRIPLPKFICEVLNYYKVHLSRLSPFGGVKLTTFALICRSYGGKFFYIKDTVVPNEYLKLLFEDNRLDKTSFKDSILYPIRELPLMDFRNFMIPGDDAEMRFKPRDVAKMAFGNFMIPGDDAEMRFIPKEPMGKYGTRSPTSSINKETFIVSTEHVASANPKQLAENFAESKGSSVNEQTMIVRSSAAPIQTRKVKVESSLSLTISDDDSEGFLKAFKLKTPHDYYILLSNITLSSWRGHLDNMAVDELLDFHDRCYARQVVLDNVMNQRTRKLLKTGDQVKEEIDVIKKREKSRMKKYSELEAKCEAAMDDLDKNTTVIILRQKEGIESQLRQEVEDVKHDRVEVVSKVISYIAMKLVHSDEIGKLVGRIPTTAIVYGRCAALEEVTKMKEPFDLTKFQATGHPRPDPSTPIEVLHTKKPKSLRRPAPSKKSAPSKLLSPSFALSSKVIYRQEVMSSCW